MPSHLHLSSLSSPSASQSTMTIVVGILTCILGGQISTRKKSIIVWVCWDVLEVVDHGADRRRLQQVGSIGGSLIDLVSGQREGEPGIIKLHFSGLHVCPYCVTPQPPTQKKPPTRSTITQTNILTKKAHSYGDCKYIQLAPHHTTEHQCLLVPQCMS